MVPALLSADLYNKAKDEYVKYLLDVCMPRYLVPKDAAQDFAAVCGLLNAAMVSQGRAFHCETALIIS